MQNIGKILVIAGILIIVIGLIVWFAGNRLSWFGNLPGDIRIKKENFSFYMPISTMILVSVFISFILWMIRKILG
jgi:hypothetical protein